MNGSQATLNPPYLPCRRPLIGMGRSAQVVREALGMEVGITTWAADRLKGDAGRGSGCVIRFPDKIQPRLDDLMLSSPDIMPTLLGLAGLSDSIPANVQGHNYAPLFFNEKADIVRPAGALYIQNVDGKKDEDGKVRSYFPSSRGFKSARYTLALYVDRNNHKLVKSLLFDDEKDPYQMNNLPLEENKEIVDELCAEMGKVLKEIDDPWYRERILSDMIPYDK